MSNILVVERVMILSQTGTSDNLVSSNIPKFKAENCSMKKFSKNNPGVRCGVYEINLTLTFKYFNLPNNYNLNLNLSTKIIDKGKIIGD